MRNAFIDSLLKQAEKDESIWLLNADLGYSVLEPFANAFSERYMNVGVSEQNMAGMAAGLGMSGYKVFIYSIGNFPTLRCFEQLRNDVCYHNSNVTIVSVGAGFSYGSQGYSHHAIEDIGAMRLLPRMTVYSPCDPYETQSAVNEICSKPDHGPSYLRLGRAGEPNFHPMIEESMLKPHFVKDGKDIAIIATGGILGEALVARESLASRGLCPAVISVPTVKPLDEACLTSLCEPFSHVITLEEHSIHGGLFQAMSSLFIQPAWQNKKVVSLSIADGVTTGLIGDQQFMRDQCQINSQAVIDTALALCG